MTGISSSQFCFLDGLNSWSGLEPVWPAGSRPRTGRDEQIHSVLALALSQDTGTAAFPCCLVTQSPNSYIVTLGQLKSYSRCMRSQLTNQWNVFVQMLTSELKTLDAGSSVIQPTLNTVHSLHSSIPLVHISHSSTASPGYLPETETQRDASVFTGCEEETVYPWDSFCCQRTEFRSNWCYCTLPWKS